MKRISPNGFGSLILLLPFIASSQWTPTNGPFGGSVTSLGKMGEEIFAGTFTGIYRSSDNGRHWLPTQGTNYALNNRTNDFTVNGSIIYSAHPGGIFRSTDIGANWTKAQAGIGGSVQCILARNQFLFAGTDTYGIFVSIDSGKTWTRCNQGLKASDSSLPHVAALASGGKSILAGTSKGIYISGDTGKTWTLDSGISVNHFVLHGDTVIAAGDRNLYESITGGNWSDITPVTNPKQSLKFYSLELSGSDIYAGIDSGRIARSVDNGLHWEIMRIPAFRGMTVISLMTKNNSLYVGTGCGMFVSDDTCRTWTSIDTGMVNSVVPSLIVRDSGLFASNWTTVFVSKDDGTTWNTAVAGRPDAPIGNLIESDSNLLAITSDGFYLSDKAGGNWRKVNSGQLPSTCTNFTIDKESLFSWNSDSVFLSLDTGAHWSPFCRTPSYPKFLIAHYGKLYAGTTFDGLMAYDTKKLAWVNIYKDPKETTTSIYSLYFHENAMYICATSSQLCSYDKGATWKPVFSDLNGCMITAWAMSGNIFLAGVTNIYSVYISSNGGTTWSQKTFGQEFNPQSLAIKGNYAFAGTDGGGVWRCLLPSPVGIDNREVSHSEPDFEMSFFGRGAKNMTISFSLPGPDLVSIRITDIGGRTVGMFQRRYACAGSYGLTMSGLKWVSGCYLMSFQTVHSLRVKRFSIAH